MPGRGEGVPPLKKNVEGLHRHPTKHPGPFQTPQLCIHDNDKEAKMPRVLRVQLHDGHSSELEVDPELVVPGMDATPYGFITFFGRKGGSVTVHKNNLALVEVYEQERSNT